MLGIEWLTTNEARWNFLDGTIIIRNPESNVRRVNPLPTQPGQELAVRSIHTQWDDCTRLTTDSVILPFFSCAIPKEVLFQVIENLCNVAKTNIVIKRTLDNFVAKLIAGKFCIKSKGDTTDHTSEQGEFLKLLLALDRSSNNLSDAREAKYRFHEQSECTLQLCDIDGFNLPTLFW